MKITKKKVLVAIPVIIVLLFIVDILNPVYGLFCRISAGNVGIKTTFGKVDNTVLASGLHVKNIFAKITEMNIRTQKETVTVSAFSSDIQQVDVLASINFNINSTVAMDLFRNVGTAYYSNIIYPRLMENTKVVFSKYNAEALVEAREKLSQRILELMREEMDDYGIDVSSISIENIDFTDAFTTAVEEKQVAAQNKLTAETKQATLTMEAQAQAERGIIDAKAKSEILKVEADAEAYSLSAKADAEAKANQAVSASLTEMLIRYNQILQWDGKLPTVTGADTTMPIIGNIDGLVGIE